MKIALDSNVMIYAEGLIDDERNYIAQGIIARIEPQDLIIPSQSLVETYYWLVKRAKQPAAAATEAIQQWLMGYNFKTADEEVFGQAFELVTKHRLQVFDAIILASAAEAGAIFLLSEDMHEGFGWHGVTVTNPFGQPHPLVKQLLTAS